MLQLIMYIPAFFFFLHVHVLRGCFHGHKIRERALQIWYYVHAKEYEKYLCRTEWKSECIDRQIARVTLFEYIFRT